MSRRRGCSGGLVAAVIAFSASACGGADYRSSAALTDRGLPPAVSPGSGGAEAAPPGPLARRRRPLVVPTETRLSNGIRVLFVEEHAFPSATLGFVVDRGVAAAAPGVAELYTQAMYSASTKNATARDNREELSWRGARLDGNVSQDAVSLSVTAISALLPQVLPHVCAMATGPIFDDDALDGARINARTTALRARENPDDMAEVALRPLLFPDRHPYGVVPWLESPTRFTSMARNEVENFRDMFVAADRITVVVAGDVKPPAIVPGLEKCLAGLARKKGALAPPIPPPAAPSRSHVVLVPRAGASQANIWLGFTGVRRSDPSLAALLVLKSLLGRSLSGRLNLAIRGEHGYSYGVHMMTRTWREGGMIAVTTAANSAHAAETVKGLLTELARIQREPIPAPELDRAKLHAAARVTSDDGGFGGLSQLAALGLPLRHYEDLAEGIEAITEADLRAAATRFFGSTVQVAVVGDPSLAEPLRALGIGDVTIRRD